MIEIVLMVLGGLILGAFIIRVIVELLDIIYKIAPWVIVCVAAIILLYMSIEHKSTPELESQNATVIETTEN